MRSQNGAEQATIDRLVELQRAYKMTLAVQNVLIAFDALGPEEQQCVAIEILHRSAATEELSDAAFDEIAADLFRGYDAEESIGAKS